MRKLLGTILCLAMLVSLFTGFASAEAISLRFIDVSPSPVRQQYFETTFDKFFKETGISVTYESVPWDDAANKLTVLGTSGQLPDVMTTWAGWLGQFTAAGWVKPLSDYIAGTEGEYADTVTKLVWKGEKELYGNYYTVPDGVMVKGVYVRKDWAADAGLSLDPTKGWTYSEFFDAVHKLTDDLGFPLLNPFPVYGCFLIYNAEFLAVFNQAKNLGAAV
jgi:multiple sugar transport system substrate-binding protein